jgi:hypothetical protein
MTERESTVQLRFTEKYRKDCKAFQYVLGLSGVGFTIAAMVCFVLQHESRFLFLGFVLAFGVAAGLTLASLIFSFYAYDMRNTHGT